MVNDKKIQINNLPVKTKACKSHSLESQINTNLTHKQLFFHKNIKNKPKSQRTWR